MLLKLLCDGLLLFYNQPYSQLCSLGGTSALWQLQKVDTDPQKILSGSIGFSGIINQLELFGFSDYPFRQFDVNSFFLKVIEKVINSSLEGTESLQIAFKEKLTYPTLEFSVIDQLRIYGILYK